MRTSQDILSAAIHGNSFSKHEIKNLGSPSCSKCKKLYQRNELCPAIGYRHSVWSKLTKYQKHTKYTLSHVFECWESRDQNCVYNQLKEHRLARHFKDEQVTHFYLGLFRVCLTSQKIIKRLLILGLVCLTGPSRLSSQTTNWVSLMTPLKDWLLRS